MAEDRIHGRGARRSAVLVNGASSDRGARMGSQAVFAMAVGGMVGGGIFSVLGVVVGRAGMWAWLSFVLAGAVALATGRSYVALSVQVRAGGGAFAFLRDAGHHGSAASLAWLLIFGYVLTVAVYAFTFGHYLGEVLGVSDVLVRVLALCAVAVIAVVNVIGVGSASGVEIVTVWGKLLILLGLAAIGLWRFSPAALEEVPSSGPVGVLVGAASVFMAYEGFQLVAYDYDDIDRPERVLPRVVPLAIACVIVVYVVVTLGASSLVGARTIVEQKEVALAAAGEAALGVVGKVLVSIAAVFSTASAINATLFATARLTRDVAGTGDLPGALARENRRGVPVVAVLLLAGAAAVLAVVGSLTSLVETASLVFLFTFTVVNAVAARRVARRRWISWFGAGSAGVAAAVLVARLALELPLALALVALAVLVATIGRARAFPAAGRFLGRVR